MSTYICCVKVFIVVNNIMQDNLNRNITAMYGSVIDTVHIKKPVLYHCLIRQKDYDALDFNPHDGTTYVPKFDFSDIWSKQEIRQIVFSKGAVIVDFSGENHHDNLDVCKGVVDALGELGIPGNQVIYLSGKHNEKSIRKTPAYVLHLPVFDYYMRKRYNDSVDRVKFLQDNTQEKLFVCPMRRLNSLKTFRTRVLLDMYDADCIQHGMISHMSMPENYRRFFTDDECKKLDSILPLWIDYNMDDTHGSEILHDPYKGKGYLSPYSDMMVNTYFHATVETWIDQFFITEKTFRPMYHKMPVLILGGAGSNTKIKEYGYKTYEDWFDLSWDNEPDDDKRIKCYVKEIQRVCNLLKNMSVQERIDWSTNNLDVLEHNYNNMKQSDFIENQFAKLADYVNQL